MSYEIYTTRGVVLSQIPVGEADRVYNILTRDLGLVRARAIGVRKDVSKLRGSLEPISISSVSLVRGKDHWRLTSAELVQKVLNTEHILRPLSLLEKLVQGEMVNQDLFDSVESTLSTTKEIVEEDFVAHILFHLGYLREEDLQLEGKDLIRVINEGLKESSLVNH